MGKDRGDGDETGEIPIAVVASEAFRMQDVEERCQSQGAEPGQKSPVPRLLPRSIASAPAGETAAGAGHLPLFSWPTFLLLGMLLP